MLLVSELVTNSVVHAGGPVTLRAQLDGPVLQVNVDDTAATLPAPRQPDTTGGRGLHIVAALATDWGSAPRRGDGKTTWFTLGTGGPYGVEGVRPR
jgi:two-component sensor histidine kinase